MEIIGYIASLLVGTLFGILGSGGSIFTIPILVYLLNIKPISATTYSFFIVFITAFIGSLQNFKNKQTHFQSVIYFGIASIIAVFVTRVFILPIIPDIIIDNWLTKNTFIMILFSVLMIFAAYAMIKKQAIVTANKQTTATINKEKIRNQTLILYGTVLGVISGIIGVGGGFLIIPLLVYAAHITMQQAASTSLVIISLNAAIGFIGSLQNTQLNWKFLMLYSTFSVIGILIGLKIVSKISSAQLKPIFGWMILIMGIVILTKELLLK